MNIRFYCTARSKKECAYWKIVPRKDRCGGCTIYMSGEFGEGVCNIDSCNNFAPVCEHAIHGECTSEMCKAHDNGALENYGTVVGIRDGWIKIKYTEENSGRFFEMKDCKPVLRKFNAITVEEAEEFNKFKDPKGRFDALLPLLQAGVDVFGWIDLGLAEEDKR